MIEWGDERGRRRRRAPPATGRRTIRRGRYTRTRKDSPMPTVQVRYIVDDVAVAAAFYRQHLGFREVMSQPPSFAMLVRDDLRLVLSVPGAPNTGGGSALPDGRTPEPGGWNRFAVEVDDVAATVERLQASGVRLRGGVIRGTGGDQAIIEDPSGNPIELFEPKRPEARLDPRS